MQWHLSFQSSVLDWPQLRLGVSCAPTQTCAHRRSHHIVQGQNSASCRGGQRNLPVPQHWASADTAAPWYEQKSAASGAQSAVQPEIKQMWMKTRCWISLSCQNSEQTVEAVGCPCSTKCSEFRASKKYYIWFLISTVKTKSNLFHLNSKKQKQTGVHIQQTKTPVVGSETKKQLRLFFH